MVAEDVDSLFFAAVAQSKMRREARRGLACPREKTRATRCLASSPRAWKAGEKKRVPTRVMPAMLQRVFCYATLEQCSRASKMSKPVNGRASAWSTSRFTCALQPCVGPNLPRQIGSMRRRRRSATCMAWAANVMVGSAAMAASHDPARGRPRYGTAPAPDHPPAQQAHHTVAENFVASVRVFRLGGKLLCSGGAGRALMAP